ncbi:hypothetical protein FRX31_015598, partial [Thalictrum thalictroides]
QHRHHQVAFVEDEGETPNLKEIIVSPRSSPRMISKISLSSKSNNSSNPTLDNDSPPLRLGEDDDKRMSISPPETQPMTCKDR